MGKQPGTPGGAAGVNQFAEEQSQKPNGGIGERGIQKLKQQQNVLASQKSAGGLGQFHIITPSGSRIWHAESPEHAIEQHQNAFEGDPDEEILDVKQGGPSRYNDGAPSRGKRVNPRPPTRSAAYGMDPEFIYSKSPSGVKVEFGNRVAGGAHPDEVFKQLIAEIADHHRTGQIDDRDAHRAANEALGRMMMAHKKIAWSGWGPSTKHHKVAGWDWDDHFNGWTSTASRKFNCSCGEPVEVPSYHNCKCGKILNAYVIGTGGNKKEAQAEKFVVREIPNRDGVIVANKQACGDAISKSSDDPEDLPSFPSDHHPDVKSETKGTSKDWHKRDHSTQRWVK